MTKEELIKNLNEAYNIAQASIDKQEEVYQQKLIERISRCYDQHGINEAMKSYDFNMRTLYRNKESNASRILLLEELIELNNDLQLPDSIFTVYASQV